MKLEINQVLLRKLEGISSNGEVILWAGIPNPKAQSSLKLFSRIIILGFIALIAIILFTILQGLVIAKFFIGVLAVIAAIIRLSRQFFTQVFYSIKNMLTLAIPGMGDMDGRRITGYGFSDQGVLVNHGPSKSDVKTIPYKDIIDIEVKKGFISNMYNTGTIKIYTGKTKTHVRATFHQYSENLEKIYTVWYNVDQAHMVYSLLQNAMSSAKNSNNQAFHRPEASYTEASYTETSKTPNSVESYGVNPRNTKSSQTAGAAYRKRMETKERTVTQTSNRASSRDNNANNIKRLRKEDDLSKDFEAILEANEKKASPVS